MRCLHHVSSLSGIGGSLRPGVVHRLDKDTSGCLVVAKDDLAHLRLSKPVCWTRSSKILSDTVCWSFCKLSRRNYTSRSVAIRCIVKKWLSSTAVGPLTPVSKLSRKQADGLSSFAKFTRDEPTRFGSISIRSDILSLAIRCTEKHQENTHGRCCTRGVWDFFIQ